MCWYPGCEPPEDFDSMGSDQTAEWLKTTYRHHHNSHQEAKYDIPVPEKKFECIDNASG
jgi:hypothetical protein